MRAKNFIMAAAAAAMLSGLAGCGGAITYTIKGTPKSPELDGKVVFEPFKEHGFTTVKVNLEHLAPPDRLGGGRHFVAWAKDEKGRIFRIGALKYDEGSRKAVIEGASTPNTSFDFIISVEKENNGEGPTTDPVYLQHVN